MTAVALLSGGLDSTVATTLQHRQGGVVLALNIDYRQRAATREAQAARAVAQALGIPYRRVALDFLGGLSAGALLNRGIDLPHLEAHQLDEVRGAAARSMKSVWVPNRNGLFIAIAASFAESLGATDVVVGFNKEEAATFPDNSQAFLAAASASLELSTLNHVKVVSPTATLDKAEIVRVGYEADAPLRHVWSCYSGEERPCWRCESCLRLKRALERGGRFDRFVAEWSEGT